MDFSLERLQARLPHPALAQALPHVLNIARQPLFVVGGFVRDVLLGLPPDDFDLVVEGDAPALARALAQAHGGRVVTHPTFRTATWHVPAGPSIDLASARTEHYPQPASLPVVHTPARLEDDLHRRDFSLNALAVALNGTRPGLLLDPLDGQADLRARLIRILHPRSFVDDPTRIFRAARYASRLQFALETETQRRLAAALTVIPLLTGDRARHEFEVIFRETAPAPILRQLDSLGALTAVHPALHWSPAADALAADLPALPTPAQPLAWWALLLVTAAPAQAADALARLNVPRAAREAVLAALTLRDCPTRPSQAVQRLERAPALGIHVASVLYPDLRPIFTRYLTDWQNQPAPLTGADLRAWGVAPGPVFKEVLWQVRAARLDGRIASRAEAEALARALLAEHP